MKAGLLVKTTAVTLALASSLMLFSGCGKTFSIILSRHVFGLCFLWLRRRRGPATVVLGGERRPGFSFCDYIIAQRLLNNH